MLRKAKKQTNHEIYKDGCIKKKKDETKERMEKQKKIIQRVNRLKRMEELEGLVLISRGQGELGNRRSPLIIHRYG